MNFPSLLPGFSERSSLTPLSTADLSLQSNDEPNIECQVTEELIKKLSEYYKQVDTNAESFDQQEERLRILDQLLNSGLFNLITDLIKNDDWKNIEELLCLIPNPNQSNQTLFLIISELIKNDHPIEFDKINKLINLIENKNLKSECYVEVVNKILNTIEDYTKKLAYSDSDKKSILAKCDNPLSQLTIENLHSTFDLLDESDLVNLYLSDRYLNYSVNEYFIKEINLSKALFYWVLEFCKINNDYSIIGSIFDSINQIKNLNDLVNNKNSKPNIFILRYTIAELFKNTSYSFFKLQKFIKKIESISVEEKKFLSQMCHLIDLSIKLNNLKKNHWSKNYNLDTDYSIMNGNIQIFYQYDDLKFSENLRYLYYLLKHDPSFRHPLLIYFTIHFLIQKNQIVKAKKLTRFLPRYQETSFSEKIDAFLSPKVSKIDRNAKIHRQIAEIALFEIHLAEKNFDEASKIVKKIMNHEEEYLLFNHNYRKGTNKKSYNKAIYEFFSWRLLEHNQYDFPIQMMQFGCIESWQIESKVYQILLRTEATFPEVKKVANLFPDGQIKNEFLCTRAIKWIECHQIKEAMNLVLYGVKLTLKNHEDFRSTIVLSDVINKLVEKNLIDESIKILHFISKTQGKIFIWGFQIVFDYLIKHDKEKFSKLITTLNEKLTFKALEAMIILQLKCVHHGKNDLIKEETEEVAYLIKSLPASIEIKEEYINKLTQILKRKNLKDLGQKVEEFFSKEKEESHCIIS